jgi:hypothetical protein
MVQQREGSMGNLSRASLGLRRWCGTQATAEKRWQRRNSVAVVLELRGRGKVRGGGVLKAGEVVSLL